MDCDSYARFLYVCITCPIYAFMDSDWNTPHTIHFAMTTFFMCKHMPIWITANYPSAPLSVYLVSMSVYSLSVSLRMILDRDRICPFPSLHGMAWHAMACLHQQHQKACAHVLFHQHLWQQHKTSKTKTKNSIIQHAYALMLY